MRRTATSTGDSIKLRAKEINCSKKSRKKKMLFYCVGSSNSRLGFHNIHLSLSLSLSLSLALSLIFFLFVRGEGVSAFFCLSCSSKPQLHPSSLHHDPVDTKTLQDIWSESRFPLQSLHVHVYYIYRYAQTNRYSIRVYMFVSLNIKMIFFVYFVDLKIKNNQHTKYMQTNRVSSSLQRPIQLSLFCYRSAAPTDAMHDIVKCLEH